MENIIKKKSKKMNVFLLLCSLLLVFTVSWAIRLRGTAFNMDENCYTYSDDMLTANVNVESNEKLPVGISMKLLSYTAEEAEEMNKNVLVSSDGELKESTRYFELKWYLEGEEYILPQNTNVRIDIDFSENMNLAAENSKSDFKVLNLSHKADEDGYKAIDDVIFQTDSEDGALIGASIEAVDLGLFALEAIEPVGTNAEKMKEEETAEKDNEDVPAAAMALNESYVTDTSASGTTPSKAPQRAPGKSGVYFHGMKYPGYQTSQYMLIDNNRNIELAQTFVLVPRENLSYSSSKGYYWQLPSGESNQWSAKTASQHTYEVAYCMDAVTPITKGSLETDNNWYSSYYDRTEIENYGGFTPEQKEKLRGIIENSYPFLTDSEMLAVLEQNGISVSTENIQGKMTAAVQWAIWSITNPSTMVGYGIRETSVAKITLRDYNPQFWQIGTDYYGNPIYQGFGYRTLNPIYDPNLSSSYYSDTYKRTVSYSEINEITAIKDWLVNDAESSQMEIVSLNYSLSSNGDNTANVIVTVNLSRPLTAAEAMQLDATLLVDGMTNTVKVPTGVTEFNIPLENVPYSNLKNGKVTLSGMLQDRMHVYHYLTQGTLYNNNAYDRTIDLQNMISASWEPEQVELETDFEIDSSITSVLVQKVWDDNENPERPEAVTVNLLQNGQVYMVATLSSNNNWKYTWINLPRVDATGAEYTYSVREIVVDGYTAEVTNEGNSFIITNRQEEVPQAQLIIKKTDSTDNSKYLSGAVFEVYQRTSSGGVTIPGTAYTGVLAETVTTDAQGKAYLSDLVEGGMFYIVETKAPSGYMLDSTAYPFYYYNSDIVYEGTNQASVVIYENGIPVITRTNEPSESPPEDAQIILKKADSEDPVKLLAGAEFELYKKNLQTGKTTVPGTNIKADLVGAFTTNESGVAYIKGIDTKSFSDYYLVETKAPEGYKLDPSPVKMLLADTFFWVTFEGKPKSDITDKENGLYVLTVNNEKDIVQAYMLPETGGIGTRWFNITGLVLITISIMYGCVKLRKNRQA